MRLLVICLLLVGCEKKYENIRLQCGNCRRTIYDGPSRDVHGFRWPAGHVNRCSEWDINCISELMPSRDLDHKSYWGHQRGRQDALEFRYEQEFDTKTHHPAYIEGYKKGYKEVIDVRRLGSKGDE